eukprot:CAMPEP_0114986080 /NCGR_PEP_ID=MMETSP0216-20121206/8234_1 /TAXON_ID=223996 /ORGANISM="Protocruzia adherens, Strain Boccale" /LENGTH=362 /DNA_ID=CAMNT_0002348489 /DNA_START=126 /DNA_END=1214 /DNA_ORIENTATION=+
MDFRAIFLVLTAVVLTCQADVYEVTAQRMSLETMPLVSSQKGQSSFTYNYNPSYLPRYENGQLLDGLLIRSQNSNGQPYGVGPSVISYTEASNQGKVFDVNHVETTNISDDNVVFSSEGEAESYGVEDPRVAYRDLNETYYMFYSAVQQYPDKVVSRLAMATTQTPLDKSSWVRHGAVFPEEKWSKSGALLLRDDVPGSPHYLYWGDSDITVAAASEDLTSFHNLHTFISVRENHFDSSLVESGPPPLRLSDGNYLFIYNSARPHPSAKPGYAKQYNPGWVIIDGTDPTKILQRAEIPLMSPVENWETGKSPELDLTPNVVFIEAAKALGDDTFLVFYGAADSVVGVAKITVTKSAEESWIF